jgi:hypothetical protein
VSTLLPASCTVAVNCCVPPTCTLAVAGLTATDATGTAVTVTTALPLTPSLVAVIVAVPGASARTTPFDDTVATAVLLEAHAIDRPSNTLPPASRKVPVTCCDPPTGRLAICGLRATEATGGRTTRIVAVPLMPSLVPVTVALPAAIANTSPLADTVAMEALLDDQITARAGRRFPAASRAAADSCWDAPTCRLAEEGETATAATDGEGLGPGSVGAVQPTRKASASPQILIPLSWFISPPMRVVHLSHLMPMVLNLHCDFPISPRSRYLFEGGKSDQTVLLPFAMQAAAVFLELWARGNRQAFNAYLRYYLSDHRPMWVEVRVG